MVLAQVILVGIINDGFFYSAAHAQCAATDKIYIDPSLVPKRPTLSREGFSALMNNRNPNAEKMNQYLLQQHMQRNQPIEVPYGTGRVLVHPDNPCIQQYIP